MKGRLFVISAPSGTGKTTVIHRLSQLISDAVLSVSVTTRKPRSGESDKVDYNFITEEEFEKLRDEDGLLEWASVHGHFYGTPRVPIERWLRDDKRIILDIDVQGGRNIKKNFPEAVLIFLVPPSREELLRRLSERGTNNKEDIKERTANAEKELKQKRFYDFQIINDKIDETVAEIKEIICSD